MLEFSPLMDGSPEEDALPPLPEAYQNDAFRALPRDARTIYLWWDLHPDTAGDEPLFLRVETEAGKEEQLLPVEEIFGRRLLEVREPGTTYALEIGRRDASGTWCPVTPILPVRMPRDTPPEGDPVYVTIAPDA